MFRTKETRPPLALIFGRPDRISHARFAEKSTGHVKEYAGQQGPAMRGYLWEMPGLVKFGSVGPLPRSPWKFPAMTEADRRYRLAMR